MWDQQNRKAELVAGVKGFNVGDLLRFLPFLIVSPLSATYSEQYVIFFADLSKL